jgi:DNA polymerase III delta subunit
MKGYYVLVLYVFTGNDTEKARAAMQVACDEAAKGASVVRITDAHSRTDLEAALGGQGLFGEERVVVFDNVFLNDEMRELLVRELPRLAKSDEVFFMIEGALDAVTRKGIEKYAEKFERFDARVAKKQETIFSLANALQAGKKKDLWVGYQRELLAGEAPEAIHGVLFWAAKQYYLRNSSERARKLVAELAELPHEARRRGEDLEYALERFVLSVA